jgi:hypothetical protein
MLLQRVALVIVVPGWVVQGNSEFAGRASVRVKRWLRITRAGAQRETGDARAFSIRGRRWQQQ